MTHASLDAATYGVSPVTIRRVPRAHPIVNAFPVVQSNSRANRCFRPSGELPPGPSRFPLAARRALMFPWSSMKRTDDLPMPFVSAWDPRAASSGSIDPLGALRAFTAIATALLPGVTTITSRVRYLSWVCAGLRLLDEAPDAPSGGRAGRARRQRILAWERLLALATGTFAKAEGVAEDDACWRQLRGVSYVRRAVAEGIRSPAFPMLRNQSGVGAVGTYWVTLVAGGLVEDDSGSLTPRGTELAEVFLRRGATPDRARLRNVIRGEDVNLAENALVEWGRSAHLGAADSRERLLLADALLEPGAHRRMAAAMKSTGGASSDGVTFRRLGDHLRAERDPMSDRLASVLAVASAFEDLHRELLYRFDQIRALGRGRPAPAKSIRLASGSAALPDLGDALKGLLGAHADTLPLAVADAIHGFSLAVAPAVRARDDAQIVEALVRHHERVQSGKLDASRQPKLPWVELRGTEVAVAPRFALDERPTEPGPTSFTHPYRVEQFASMLRETGVWEGAA